MNESTISTAFWYIGSDEAKNVHREVFVHHKVYLHLKCNFIFYIYVYEEVAVTNVIFNDPIGSDLLSACLG